MSRLLYFAYGSNLHPLRLRQRVPSSRPFGVASLSGYQLRFHKNGRDGSGKCNVFFTGLVTDRVYGVLYQMAVAEKPLLDAAEGVGNGYDVHEIEVLTEVHGTQQAFSYVAAVGHIDDGLAPYDWYHALVVAGARHHQLPAEYVDRIAAVTAVADPDRERHLLHQRILSVAGRPDGC